MKSIIFLSATFTAFLSLSALTAATSEDQMNANDPCNACEQTMEQLKTQTSKGVNVCNEAKRCDKECFSKQTGLTRQGQIINQGYKGIISSKCGIRSRITSKLRG